MHKGADIRRLLDRRLTLWKNESFDVLIQEAERCDRSLRNSYAKQKHPWCKKSARPIRSSIANRYVRPKTLISVEAKKLLIKNLLE